MKVALLPLYIKLYDEVAPKYRSAVEAFVNNTANFLRELDMEVVATPVCCVKDEFTAAVRDIEAAGCEVIVTLHAAYSPSLESIDALAATDLPLVVMDITPDYEFSFEKENKIMANHGIHGVQDMCNLLLQRGKKFLICSGHCSCQKFVERFREMVLAAAMTYKFTHMRVGSVGGVFDGMGDFRIPEGSFNMYLSRYELDSSLIPSEEEINAEMELDNKLLRVNSALPEAVHRATIKECLKLRKWIEREQLEAFSINFLRADRSMRFETITFLECSKAMARGIGYAGEGDVLTAMLCKTLMMQSDEVTFSEMFCPDWQGNRIFLSHMGEMNTSLMAQKPHLMERKWIFSDCGDAAIAYGCLKAGSAMLVNLAPGGNGKFTLIAAPVSMSQDDDCELQEMRGWFTPAGDMPIADFLEQYSRLGGTHHLVLSYGINAKILQQFAELMNWDFKLISA